MAGKAVIVKPNETIRFQRHLGTLNSFWETSKSLGFLLPMLLRQCEE
jgi:hypothetical protein